MANKKKVREEEERMREREREKREREREREKEERERSMCVNMKRSGERDGERRRAIMMDTPLIKAAGKRPDFKV